jgi:hypothetical protein
MNLTQKFFERLRNELKLDIPKDACSISTHAGRHQRSAGAWTSFLKSDTNKLFEIGLYRSISKLMKCPKLEVDGGYTRADVVIDCGCIGKCKGEKNVA